MDHGGGTPAPTPFPVVPNEARSQLTINEWRDPQFAQQWVGQDVLQDLLDLPRAIAAAIVAADQPDSRLVIDIASGPGAFLERFLSALPVARGVWSDVSSSMASLAREQLAPYAPRVDFQIVDMADLSGLPFDADVIISSRASHHLSVNGLREFYAGIHDHLVPGGWVVNLDHTYSDSAKWEERVRAARTALIPPARDRRGHHHTSAPPTAADHLAALRAAGFTDLDMPWRAFPTCLFMARRNDAGS
jgi:SAM-dependent methyltransferase